MFTQFNDKFLIDQQYIRDDGVTHEFVFDPTHYLNNNPSNTYVNYPPTTSGCPPIKSIAFSSSHANLK